MKESEAIHGGTGQEACASKWLLLVLTGISGGGGGGAVEGAGGAGAGALLVVVIVGVGGQRRHVVLLVARPSGLHRRAVGLPLPADRKSVV